MFHCIADPSAAPTVLKVDMSTLIRVALLVYLAQAAAGLAAGFILPWLLFFGAQ